MKKQRFEITKKKNKSVVIKRKKLSDTRGFLERLFCKKEFNKILGKKEIVQINRSLTKKRGTIRGMHYQVGSSAEDKIITCIKGKVYDVIVDLRKKSKTFLKSYSFILDQKKNTSIFVPAGFAPGFQTLTDNCELIYFHTNYYNFKKSKTLNYLDPKLKISWPIKTTSISKKDKKQNFIS